MFDINTWHRKQIKAGSYPVIRRLDCSDGFHMSVQASKGHYCAPREDNAWPYFAFEVGFPSAVEPTLGAGEDEIKPNETIYGWVPATVIEEIVNRHGGVKE